MPIYPYSFTLPPVNKQDIPSDGVAGEFLGISAGGVLDWLPVSGGSGSGDLLAANNLSELTPTAGTARTNLGLGTGDSPTFKNLVISTGTITTSAPVTISQTWADIAQTFKALVVNAAGTSDANSASGSLLADFQVNGVSRLNVGKSGDIIGANNFTISSTGSITGKIQFTSSFGPGTGLVLGTYNGFNVAGFYFSNFTGNTLAVAATGAFGFCPNSAINAEADTVLRRDAANTLALRNGSAAQTFNVYGSYGSISDYKRLSISCDQTTGNATITNQAAGYTAGTVSINGVPVGRGGGNFSSNIAIGGDALAANVANALCTAVGNSALRFNTNGSQNCALGASALYLTSSGGGNTGVGHESLFYNSTGGNTTAIGYQAGRLMSTGNNTGAVSNSVYIGALTKALGAGETNQIVIGYDATGLGSNSVVIGNSTIDKTALRGNVGIGTTAPSSKLHVDGVITVTDIYPAPNVQVSSNDGFNIHAGGTGVTVSGVQLAAWTANEGAWINSAYPLSWGTSRGNKDTVIQRDGEPDHLAMRRSTNGQKFSVYGTYPGAAWERFTITAPTSGNVLLGTYKGTGGIARGLELQTDGVTRMVIDAAGETFIGVGFTGLRVSVNNASGGGSVVNIGGGGASTVTGRSSGSYGWTSDSSSALHALRDTALFRNAAGVVEINNGTAGTFRDLRVRSVIQQPPASITPASNGDYVVEATNNTTLTFRLRGSDGTVRSATLTLAP